MNRDGEPGTGGRTDATEDRRRLIVNPTSGTADHVEAVRRLASERGYSLVETERAGHAVSLATEAAADGIHLLAACGGDGTVHEVVEGIAAAGALDDVTLGVVPAGTANYFAGEIGVDGIEDGFDALERGETRRIDLGVADDEPFVLSCIAGLPADASAAATSGMKERFGSLAFVITAVQEASSFDGVRVEVDVHSPDEETTWTGEVLSVLVGNARRFGNGGGQANVEDGLFEVVIVEEMPTGEMVAEAVEHRLFGRETDHVRHLTASRLDVVGRDGSEIEFSLDGEIVSAERLSLSVRPRALNVRVGESYEPDPTE